MEREGGRAMAPEGSGVIWAVAESRCVEAGLMMGESLASGIWIWSCWRVLDWEDGRDADFSEADSMSVKRLHST